MDADVQPLLSGTKARKYMLILALEPLDTEAEEVRQKDEYGMFRRLLKSELQKLVDRHSILHTTMVELALFLRLEDCVIWMPSDNQTLLQISHSLKLPQNDSSTDQPVISLADQTVQMVLKESWPIRIPVESELARYSCTRTSSDVVEIDYVFAVRLPLLNISTFCSELIRQKVSTEFAVIVLVVPMKEQIKWGERETDIVEAAVDQVIIAISHATVMEESLKTTEDLKQQSIALEFANDQSEPTMNAQNDRIPVINHKMRTPLQANGVLSSTLLEPKLNEVQKYTVGIMQRSNKVISKLMDEILQFSRLEFDSHRLNSVRFLLPELIRVAEILLEPAATSKGLQLTFTVPQNLPRTVVGDEIRILHVLLNIVVNAIKFTEKRNIRVDISIEFIKDKDYTEPRIGKLPTCANIHFVVKGMGGGINPTSIPQLFNKSDELHIGKAGSGLGWPISKEITELMKGKIWIESEGAEHGTACHFSFPVEIVHNYEHEPSLWDMDKEIFSFEVDGYTVSDMEGYGSEATVLPSGRPPSEGSSYHSPPSVRQPNYQAPISNMTPESITDTGHHSLLNYTSTPISQPDPLMPPSPKKLHSRASCQRSLFSTDKSS